MRFLFSPAALLTLLTVPLGFHVLPVPAADRAAIADPLHDPPARGFVSRARAAFWEEALISGNGTLGALVMGDPQNETIILSHERLFMPSDKALPPVPLADRLGEIRGLIDRGDYRRAARLAKEISRQNDYPEMPWTDPLVPAFDLVLKMDGQGEARDYARSVDFATGVTTVRWEDDRGVFVRRLFVSRADQVAVVSLTGPELGSVACEVRLAMRPTDEDDEGSETDGVPRGIRDAQITAKGSWLTYRSRFARPYPGSCQGYEGGALVCAKGGSIDTSGKTVRVTGADELILLARVAVLNDFAESTLEQMQRELTGLPPRFDVLLDRHVAVHGEIFNRSRLGLADDTRRRTSEELLASSSRGHLDPELLDRLYDASRYAVLSSTGAWPPTLQGIWTGTWAPPWMSDFTINGNVQTAIASMLSANMPECLKAYFALMEGYVPHFRDNARQMYGCRGILTPARVSTHGHFNHFNDEYIHLFWTAGAGWASQFFYDYYQYTGDTDFLRERALPFMRETASFYEDFLVDGPDGKYVFCPSYSPENTAGNSDSQACLNATMDIAVCRELLRNLIAACTELGVEKDRIPHWRSMIEKLPDYMINEDGAVKEWTTEKLEDHYEHRHASHLYALYAGLPDEIAQDPRLQRAFRRAIERRMEYYRGEGGEMAFGLVQLGLAAASLGEAELAYEAVDRLANDYWRPNLVSTHNPGEIFNVDICGGLPAVVNQMLVQSDKGHLLLLPALPAAWPSGRIEGILCRGQIEVELLEWDREEVRVKLRSGKKQVVRLSLRGSRGEGEVTAGPAEILPADNDPGAISVALPRAATVTVHWRR